MSDISVCVLICVLSSYYTCSIESRYLLIMSESLSVLSLIEEMLDGSCEVVFGSDFKDDIPYTRVSCP